MRKVYLGRDNPVLDPKYPAGAAGFTCTTEEATLFGQIYYAEGLNNPTIVMCHGCPGREKNYDIAQSLRQAGFNVLLFSYRGAWGSLGNFSFSAVAEDTVNVARQVMQNKLPVPERFDPKRVVILGHSMGGFAAVQAAAALPEIRDVALLAAWNIGVDAQKMTEDAETKTRLGIILAAAAECLTGATEKGLMDELERNAKLFDLRGKASALTGKRVLIASGEQDVLTPVQDHHKPLVQALLTEKVSVTENILQSDHNFTSKRSAITQIILDWLAEGGY